MFLKCHPRIKDGKEHRYWSIVENRRCGRDKYIHRQVLYLGEINDSQRESWCRTIEVFDENRERTLPLALFPAELGLDEFWAERLSDSREGTSWQHILQPRSAIDSLIRAANGGCIDSGLSKARWEICWMKIIRW